VPALLLALFLLQSDDALLKDLQALTQLGLVDEPTLRATVDETLPRVAKVMHASVPRKFSTKIVSRAEAARRLKVMLEREYPGDRLARLGAALKAVHLVERGVDLEKQALGLYAANAGGFYDPHDRTLYLLGDQPAVVQQLVIAHELAHAVQDEQLGLERATHEAMHSEDAQLALMAAIEGNAQAVAAAVISADSADEDGMTAALVAESTAMSASMAAESSGAIPWLAFQLSFPYTAGGELVRALATKDDPAACRLLSRLPSSTAQVLNPAAYRRNEAPLRGSIGLSALLGGAERIYETTLGRANIELLSRLHGADPIGDGWRGDVLEVVRRGATQSAVWAVVFKEARQAEAFATFYAKLVGGRRQADALAIEERDGLISAVILRGNTTVVLDRVPLDRRDATTDAAGRALR
jgi:hypothetical protein